MWKSGDCDAMMDPGLYLTALSEEPRQDNETHVENTMKRKSRKKAAANRNRTAPDTGIPISGLSLPGVVGEPTFLAQSPGRSRILEIADRRRKTRLLQRINFVVF